MHVNSCDILGYLHGVAEFMEGNLDGITLGEGGDVLAMKAAAHPEFTSK